MSIVPNRQTVYVIPMVKVRDPQFNGWKLTRGKRVPVHNVTVQPFGVDRMAQSDTPDELEADDQLTVRGRGTWPGGPKSLVEVDGIEYDQEGLVKQHKIGIHTKHFFVRIQVRKAPVK